MEKKDGMVEMVACLLKSRLRDMAPATSPIGKLRSHGLSKLRSFSVFSINTGITYTIHRALEGVFWTPVNAYETSLQHA